MTALPIKKIRPRRYQPGGLGTWSGHLPFVHDLVEAMRPGLYVELGTHYGESYFGVCQAVEETHIACRCFAVDTWRGDSHAGFYDDSVYAEVAEYNSSNYPTFSTLVRSTFDQAISRFADGSIDLLHIDGLHTYGAVKHDFENWLPKVRPGGILLLHDTEVRHADFGVWELWEELRQSFDHFGFVHSWGLGLIRKPGNPDADSLFVRQLWHCAPQTGDFIRHYYVLAAEAMDAALQASFYATAPSDASSGMGNPQMETHLRRELRMAAGERDRMRMDRDHVQAELTAARAESRQMQERRKVLESEIADLQRELSTRAAEIERLHKAVQSENTQRIALLNSYSWKASLPFRRVFELLRIGPTRR